MEQLQHKYEQIERRVMSRMDADLRFNYQIISEEMSLKDPYDPHFVLPRYFLLLAELDQFDQVLINELKQLNEKDQKIAKILSLFNQKLNLITGTMYDSIVQSMLPVPEQINLSEAGLSFFTENSIAKDSYIHVTLSHPDNFFHLAAIAQVVYAKFDEEHGYRIGCYFISLHPHDREKIAECLESYIAANP
ncbi:PilZ domain-containing protein [Acinetobacter sp. MB5]|uniref:PilZ domain-containing protein n=1 Tax=Acinetobacter sp. MB5 TaxID=2069438 RepID=UPI000DD0D0F2|nr:PilZ domain-containing protein [Acinetobacter sp. MB5]